MDVVSLPPHARPVTPQAAEAQRVLRAAQDFEAVLLGSLLRSLQETLSAVPGEDRDVGSDDYRYLGTQALAAGLAASGGLGIADMIVRNLQTSLLVKDHGLEPRSGARMQPTAQAVGKGRVNLSPNGTEEHSVQSDSELKPALQ